MHLIFIFPFNFGGSDTVEAVTFSSRSDIITAGLPQERNGKVRILPLFQDDGSCQENVNKTYDSVNLHQRETSQQKKW